MTDPLPLRTCGRCDHWLINAMKPTKDGYAEAVCARPVERTTINPTVTLTRASDTCSAWTPRQPEPEPTVIDYFGFG